MILVVWCHVNIYTDGLESCSVWLPPTLAARLNSRSLDTVALVDRKASRPLPDNAAPAASSLRSPYECGDLRMEILVVSSSLSSHEDNEAQFIEINLINFQNPVALPFSLP